MSIDYSNFAFPKNVRVKDKKLINNKSHRCEFCNKKNCYTNTHHVKSKGAGGDDTENNLIELCGTCHRKVHDGIIQKEELIKIIKNRRKQKMLNKDLKNEKGNMVLGIIIGVVILIAILIFASITTVPTGYVGVKTRFGQVQNDTIQEGLNFKMPFIEGIVKIDCRTQKTDYEMEASSKDLQKISNVKIAVNYSVDKQKANILYREIGKDFKTVIIEPAIYETIKTSVANYTAEELVTKRQEVSLKAQETLTNKLKDNGINITSLSMTDLSFSKEFDEAIEKKQVVEQQTQQAKYELEKAKVENEKKVENAKAEAEVMKQQNQQINNKTLELKRLEVQKELIKKWNGQLPTTMLNDNLSGLLNIGK